MPQAVTKVSEIKYRVWKHFCCCILFSFSCVFICLCTAVYVTYICL